jgi:hypothetical protein
MRPTKIATAFTVLALGLGTAAGCGNGDDEDANQGNQGGPRPTVSSPKAAPTGGTATETVTDETSRLPEGTDTVDKTGGTPAGSEPQTQIPQPESTDAK